MSEKELPPQGYYDGVAIPMQDESGATTYARMAYSKNKTRQVACWFELLNAGEWTGTRLPWYGFFTKDSAERTVESLRAMGLKGEALAGMETQQLDQIVSLKVGHNTWEGKTQARVDFVNAPGRGIAKLNDPMPKDEVLKFSAMMAASLAKVPEVHGERRSTKSNGSGAAHASAPPQASFGGGAQPSGVEDDIPF